MAIAHRIKPKHLSRNDEIVAELREAAGAAAPIDPYVAVKRKTAEVAVLMALIHGGDWRPVIDHETPMALVRRV